MFLATLYVSMLLAIKIVSADRVAEVKSQTFLGTLIKVTLVTSTLIYVYF